ncbi:hypothetical protein CALCODRAFT_212115 [Calocera cornea HHB12733]|uniref:CCZ1/INTU/HSP4 first Longin domain-containing protein n=1 Tax=Calocera cornea HHB12733 TaxID=1353952 RepID=A0A165HA29_9BASI|nr:hypothetical protein CALCODRAFT_212115 [Calocera cornea HHB12733]
MRVDAPRQPTSMALPAHLTHLAIYNTTLLPTAAQLQTAEDTDDAYEQAHIVFYSCQERAVSRDRMLRQVGLAKALVNFAGMFEALPSETNVHSQKKRLITFSPEQDWWIHAAFDLERIPKPVDKGKAKEKERKEKDKPPDKEKGEWEYKDELDDEVLKARLTRGYEEFKLLHGSFSEVLHTKDRPGLERSLERFFTVWASKWDLTIPTAFTTFLPAMPLHPQHSLIPPLLPPLQAHLPEGSEFMLLAPPALLHSTSPSLPDSLFHYLLALLTPPPTAPSEPPLTHPHSAHSGTETPSFLGVMSTMANPKKWGNYLTFGRSASGSSSRSPSHAREPVPRPASAPRVPTSTTLLGEANPLALKHVRTSSEPGQLDQDALVEALQDVAMESRLPSAVQAPAAGRTAEADGDVTVTMVESILPLPATELPGAETETAESVKIVVADAEEEKVPEEDSKEREAGEAQEGKEGESNVEIVEEPQEPVPPLVKVPVHLPVEGEETRAVGVLTMVLD